MKIKYKDLLLIVFLFSLIITKDIILSFTEKELIVNEVYNVHIQNILQNYEKLVKINNLEVDKNNFILSKVVTRNISDFWQFITINKGSLQDVVTNTAVINEDGLIGIIDKVGKYNARVMLLTNSKTNISVKVKDCYGILTAKNKELYIKDITDNLNIEIGQKVYTSGLTGIPGNLLIGTVKKIKHDHLDLQKILIVEPVTNLNSLKYVAVLGSE